MIGTVLLGVRVDDPAVRASARDPGKAHDPGQHPGNVRHHWAPAGRHALHKEVSLVCCCLARTGE